MFLSVVIPTYNRLPILQKCLLALERQQLAEPIHGYEVVLVDDGSTDDTVNWVRHHAAILQHVRLICQNHGGPAEGRNRGVEAACGDVIVFIDSDLVVTEDFLLAHARSLFEAWTQRGDRLCFTYGSVINTANFDEPTSERLVGGLLRHWQCGDRSSASRASRPVRHCLPALWLGRS